MNPIAVAANPTIIAPIWRSAESGSFLPGRSLRTIPLAKVFR